MNLTYINITVLSVCCFLLLGGFNYSKKQAGVLAMLAGIIGLLAVIGLNIYAALHGWPGMR